MEKKNFSVNHFLMIPFEDENFISEYEKICEKLKLNPPEGFDKELLQKKGKLHMSITILPLNMEKEKIDKVLTLLDSMHNEIKNVAEGPINFTFEKFETLGEPDYARVIYGKMAEDEEFVRLNKVIDFILSNLISANIIDESQLNNLNITKKKGKYKILLHLTLLNVTFLNKILQKQKKKPLKYFYATEILNELNNYSLPPCTLNKFNFCVMREDKATQKYELVKSYEF